MKQEDPKTLTPAEWKVMKLIWELQSCIARDVYETMNEKYGWAQGTTKSTLHRLVNKGFLNTKQVANAFIYEPATTPLEPLLNEADSLMENAIEGTTTPLFLHLMKQGNLNMDDVNELRSFLDELAGEIEESEEKTG